MTKLEKMQVRLDCFENVMKEVEWMFGSTRNELPKYEESNNGHADKIEKLKCRLETYGEIIRAIEKIM